MKRIFTLAAVAAVFIISISSCAKKGCTDPTAYNYSSSASKDDGSCLDFTGTVVGTYNGTIQDSVVGVSSTTFTNQQITVTKVDDQHITVAASNGGELTTFVAKLTAANDNYLLNIISQTNNSGIVVSGTTVTVDGITANGAYVASGNQFFSSTTFTGTGGTLIEGFVGTKQ